MFYNCTFIYNEYFCSDAPRKPIKHSANKSGDMKYRVICEKLLENHQNGLTATDLQDAYIEYAKEHWPEKLHKNCRRLCLENIKRDIKKPNSNLCYNQDQKIVLKKFAVTQQVEKPSGRYVMALNDNIQSFATSLRRTKFVIIDCYIA